MNTSLIGAGYRNVFDRETDIGGGVLKRERVAVSARIVPSVSSFEPQCVTRETVLGTRYFKQRQWGPFSWYEQVSP